MKLWTRKAIKSAFILLLSCQFLTPAFSEGVLSSEASYEVQKAILRVEAPRNPIAYISEEPSDEGKQRDAGTRLVLCTSPVQQTRANSTLFLILPSNSLTASCRQLDFDIHPLLFALHRRLLI